MQLDYDSIRQPRSDALTRHVICGAAVFLGILRILPEWQSLDILRLNARLGDPGPPFAQLVVIGGIAEGLLLLLGGLFLWCRWLLGVIFIWLAAVVSSLTLLPDLFDFIPRLQPTYARFGVLAVAGPMSRLIQSVAIPTLLALLTLRPYARGLLRPRIKSTSL